jgi:F-type H+/Na+-transporting ATPase subunit beta
MFNVFGTPIDRREPLTDVEWRSIHQSSVPLIQQSTQSEILETGIKVIDVLAPIERGGRAGSIGVDGGIALTGRLSADAGDGVGRTGGTHY